MIDLILHAVDKNTLRTFAQTYNLLVEVDDGLGGTKWVPRSGLDWSWFAGDGKIRVANAVVNQVDGSLITPPQFLNGFALQLRISKDFFLEDRLIPDESDPDKEEQWARSKVVRYVKNNGTGPLTFNLLGTDVPYYELDGVKITKPDKLDEALVAGGMPRHEIMGGNFY